MAINNIINDSWQGHTHGEVEDALKAMLAQMLQDIEAAGIPAGGVTADMLAQSLLTLINGKYSKPGTGVPANDLEGNIPASKLASAVQTSLGKADTALQSESDPVFAASAAHGITSTDINNWNNKANSAAIPTKTSDLTNDSGFVTDEDIEDFVTAESIAEIVTGSADVMVVETPGYIDIVFAEASITVKVGNDEVSGISLHTDGTAHESEQLSVSGNHLKANINAALSGAGASDYELSTDGTTYDSTALIAVTNEAVSNASLYVRYKGAKTAGTESNATLTLTAGSLSKTISLHYSYASGPYISASPATLSFSAASGSTTDAKTLAVTGYSLGADVTVSTASPFAVSLDGTTFGSSVTIPKASALAGASVYVRYTAGSTGSTGTLTLASTGATSKTVDLTGAVATLTVSPSSLSFSTDQGVAVTDSFTIQGTNLTNGVSLSITGTNAGMFTLSKNSLTKAEAETGETITVTYTPSAAGNHSGSVAVTWDGTSQNVGLSGSAAAATALDSNGRFQKGGIYYGAESDGNGGWTDNVKVYNSTYNTGATDSTNNKYSGVLNIPSTVTALKGSTETTFTVIGVAEYAFRGNTAITSITLPDTVTSMAAHILLGCTGLTYFNTGNGVTGLPYDFGNGLTALQELVIGDSVVNMKVNGAPFSGCSALRTVTLGSSVQYIGQLLDSNQGNGVTTIICRGESPTIPVVNPSTTYKIYNAANITVYIPSGQREYYVAAQDSRSDVIAGYSAKTIWKYFDDNSRLIEQ